MVLLLSRGLCCSSWISAKLPFMCDIGRIEGRQARDTKEKFNQECWILACFTAVLWQQLTHQRLYADLNEDSLGYLSCRLSVVKTTFTAVLKATPVIMVPAISYSTPCLGFPNVLPTHCQAMASAATTPPPARKGRPAARVCPVTGPAASCLM